MKKNWLIVVGLMFTLVVAATAQDTAKSSSAAKPDDHTPAVTPLRVQVVFTEFDGDKKIASLPYSFTVNADERKARPGSQIRNGVRIPISTGKDQLTYIDIGTSIDCSATLQEDGRYKLMMTVERSSAAVSNSPETSTPMVRQFKAEMNPVLRDGQTVESIVSTDPLNGHVYHVGVTLNLAK